jgi:hypothetical protein
MVVVVLQTIPRTGKVQRCCLLRVRQLSVIPTNRYVPIGGKRSLKSDPRQMHKTP